MTGSCIVKSAALDPGTNLFDCQWFFCNINSMRAYPRRDIAEIEAQQAARVSELRAELQEAAVATKQQAHLTSMAEQNYEATIAMRDARVAAAVEETERLRKSLEAAGEAERKLREELQKRGEELLDVEQGWKRRLSNAGENFEDKERHLQREVSRMTNDKNEVSDSCV